MCSAAAATVKLRCSAKTANERSASGSSRSRPVIVQDYRTVSEQ